MIIYGSYTSPYVRHIRVVLAQNEIQHDFVETDAVGAAKGSPVKRVPYLTDGSLKFTDSSSILLYVKQQAGEAGFTDASDYELFTLANTALDAEINLFMLEREGLTPENSKYLKRQRSRIQTTLKHLNSLVADQPVNINELSDGQLRLACFIDWGVFRERFSLEGLSELQLLLTEIKSAAKGNQHFIATHPSVEPF